MYSIEIDPSKTSKVQARNLGISRKNSVVVGKWIKNRHVDKAISLLNEVISKKRAVPFKIHNDSLAHKKTTKGAGKYPIIVAKKFIELLQSAKSNAEYKGLDVKKLHVSHVNANKGFQYYRPRRANLRGQVGKSTNLTIVLEER